MAPPYFFTNPEAARQNIANLQVGAAMEENRSRERIASENAAAARYATMSQMAQRDREFKTDSEIRREAIASNAAVRGGTATDALTRERANIQYRTILNSISVEDPLTKGELEAKISANPQLTDDLKNDLRAERERAYGIAKDNAAAGELVANNYRTELAGKGVSGKGIDESQKKEIYTRLSKDGNVIFDRARGTIESRFRKPREDGPVPGSGVLRMPGVQTLDEVRAQRSAPALPPTQSTIAVQPYSPDTRPSRSRMLSAPTTLVTPIGSEDYPEYSHLNMPGIGVRMEDMPGYMGTDVRPGTPRVQRVQDIAPPHNPVAGALRMADMERPPLVFESLPLADTSWFGEHLNNLVGLVQDPRNQGPEDSEWRQRILDQISEYAQRLPSRNSNMFPRVSDLQTLRPEYAPIDDRYYAPQ